MSKVKGELRAGRSTRTAATALRTSKSHRLIELLAPRDLLTKLIISVAALGAGAGTVFAAVRHLAAGRESRVVLLAGLVVAGGSLALVFALLLKREPGARHRSHVDPEDVVFTRKKRWARRNALALSLVCFVGAVSVWRFPTNTASSTTSNSSGPRLSRNHPAKLTRRSPEQSPVTTTTNHPTPTPSTRPKTHTHSQRTAPSTFVEAVGSLQTVPTSTSPPQTSIGGTLQSADGKPIAGQCVDLYTFPGLDNRGNEIDFTLTDGMWTYFTIQPGTYVAEIMPCYSSGLRFVYTSSGALTENLLHGTPITIAAGSHVILNITEPAARTISVRVLSRSSGKLLPGINLSAYLADDDYSQYAGNGNTNSNGTVSLLVPIVPLKLAAAVPEGGALPSYFLGNTTSFSAAQVIPVPTSGGDNFTINVP
jgi:hypothetical protein